MKLQRRAITSVLWIASGRSANSSTISAALLQRCSGVSRRRCSWRDLGAVGDAQQHVVGLEPVRLHEMHVVGRDQRQIVAQRELDQRRLDRVLGGEAVAHQLDVEAAGEQRHQALQHRLREARGCRAAAACRAALRGRR